jgi:uncharacterized membrane protein
MTATALNRGGAWWWGAVSVLYMALAATYASLAFWRYDIFRAGYDDGAFTQIVHSAFTGFSSTVEGGANHLLVHWSPILVLAVPFLDIGGTKGLQILQALLVAGVVFPVWAMASTRFSKPIALAVTLVAACYPPLSAQGVGDFHELAFAPLLTAFLVLAIDRRAWRWAIAISLVLVCVKEDQFVGVAGVGVFVVLLAGRDRAQRRTGWWMTAIAVGFALLYFCVVRRAIDPAFPYWSFHYYQWWWFPPTSAAGFVSWDSMIRPLYLLAALAPLAFLPLASRYLLFALPGLAEVLLSHEAITMALGTQYAATWCGYLLCAFVDGASTVGRRSQVALAVFLAAALAISIWTSANQSPITPGYALYRSPDEQDRERDRLLDALPKDASIWSHDPIFAHLSMDPNASVNNNGQEYLIFDLPQDATEYASAPIQHLLTSGTYAVTLQRANLIILHKRRLP